MTIRKDLIESSAETEFKIKIKINPSLLYDSDCVKCFCPHPEEYSMLRECIEVVKQKRYSDKVKGVFLTLVNRYDSCILGCTELPVLYEMYKSEIKCKKIYDPLLLGLMSIKEEFESE